MAGTFRLVLNVVSSRSGNWAKNAGGTAITDAEMLTATSAGGLYATNPLSALTETYIAVFGCTGNCWIIDGNPARDISSLPAGFTPVNDGSTAVTINVTNQGFGNPHNFFGSLPGSGPGETLFANQGQFYPPGFIDLTTAAIQANGCGIRCVVGNSDLNSRIIINSIILAGNYIIGPTIFSISPIKGSKFGGN